MLKTLLKKQMAEIFRTYLYDAKKNRKRSTASVILFFAMFVLLMVGVVGGMFTFLSIAICGPFAEAGMNWLYFTLMGLLAVFLGAFGSVFNTYAGLYLSKDNDLLLSMPIPVRTILTARLLSVYLMGLMYSGMVILPAAVVYWFVVPLTAGAVVGSLLLVFLISLIVLILSCALGWVVAKISLKLKNKSFITVLISLVFIGAYYFFYFKAQEMIQTLILNAAAYGEKIKGAAYPLYLFGRTGTGDWLAMLAVAAVVLALFALTWAVLARSFLKIATSTGHAKRARYRETAARVRSPFRALLGKEFRRFGSSSAYMLNCGFGTLFLPVGGIALLWKGGRLFSTLNEIFDGSTGAIPVLVTAVVCMLAAMNFMVVPSVSLEGKNLWQLQSLPVKPWQVLRAKLAVQLDSGAVLRGLLCRCVPVLPGAAGADAGGSGAVRGADRLLRPGPGAENAQPDLDQRAGSHQAELQRLCGHAGRLDLRPGRGRRVLPPAPLAGCGALPGPGRPGDGGPDRPLLRLAPGEGLPDLCGAVKAS